MQRDSLSASKGSLSIIVSSKGCFSSIAYATGLLLNNIAPLKATANNLVTLFLFICPSPICFYICVNIYFIVLDYYISTILLLQSQNMTKNPRVIIFMTSRVFLPITCIISGPSPQGHLGHSNIGGYRNPFSPS